MPQYLIRAYDHTDEAALTRRLEVRPAHLAGARKLKAAGHFILGGAILDEAGRMIGSMMVLEFNDETQLHAWFEREPYRAGGVWEKIEIQPFRVAEV